MIVCGHNARERQRCDCNTFLGHEAGGPALVIETHDAMGAMHRVYIHSVKSLIEMEKDEVTRLRNALTAWLDNWK